ncbi:MAG: amidase, partial [Microbacteriaceae bacterium]|nr:amidase [Microbacteriaceae bacterium]
QPVSAPAVQALLYAGADVVGIAQTDEFAYSIAGANPHYGTPPNPAVPGGLPGGSSSGPASAVALGQASIGLATDTAGSVRVPASYQGLWGLRTTHGRISRHGLLALAPSFDAVGWLTRDGALLGRAQAASAGPAGNATASRRLAVVPAATAALEPTVQTAVDEWVAAAVRDGRTEPPDEVDLGDIAAAYEAFRTVQAFEAWQVHGAWLTQHPGAISGAVADRFRAAAEIGQAEADAARDRLAPIRERLRAVLAERTLLLPAAASPAPRADAPAEAVDAARVQTLRLTCLAGIAGSPALSAPLLRVGGSPLGLSLVGAPDSDADLLDLAGELAGPEA